MKKLAVLGSEVLLLGFLTAQSAFAIDVQVNPPPEVIPGGAVNINTVIQFVITVLLVVGILAAVIFLIYGGIKWITSGGDKGAVEAARNHIVAAIIGLIVIVLSFVIISFVLQILGLAPSNIFDIRIPTLTSPPNIIPTCNQAQANANVPFPTCTLQAS